jgi:uncharacterized caspase-like protein
MRALAFLFVALAVSLIGLQDAQAQKRVALVVGISSYKHVPRLANPVRDSEAVAGVLKSAGFDVVEMKRDLGVAELRRSIRDFSSLASDADMAVVYYAGHGIEVDGTNYIVPADAKLESDFDVEDEGVSLDRILKSLEPAKRLRLVILDACRDNPFSKTMKRTVASRSIGRGLAKVEPTVSGTLIAFAAKAGAVASDGEGGNSPFTMALVKHIAQPGLDLRLAFGKVRDDVVKATNNRQEPFVYGSLGGDTMSLVPPLPVAPAPPPVPAVDPKAEARKEYEFAAQIGTKQAWESFLKSNKSGFYADLAQANLDKIAAAEQARAKADDVRRQAELQEKAKADEFRRQLEEHEARQAEESKRKVSEEVRQRLEEVRRQGAEQAKRELDEARRQLEAARKQADDAQSQIEVAKRVAVEDARKQLEDARREAEARAKSEAREQVAALAPGVSPPAAVTTAPVVPAMDPSDLARLLQAHLKRVGCDPGTLEGNWNDSSSRSLQKFNENAGTKFNVKVASLDALDAVRSKTSRVCPLVCGKGQKAEDEKCVQITCDPGFSLTAQGVCRKNPPPAAAPAKTVARQPAQPSAAPAARSGGGKCFSFNGRQYCE